LTALVQKKWIKTNHPLGVNSGWFAIKKNLATISMRRCLLWR